MPTGNLAYGAWLILASEFCLVCAGMVIKHLGDQVSTEQTVFFRNLFGLALFLPWLWRNGVGVLKTNCLHLHFGRALMGVAAMTCMFYAWGHLPLAEAALLKQTMPLFIPIIAFVWMRERLAWQVIAAIGLGFVGVLLVLHPSQGETVINLAVLAALAGAMLGGSTKVSVRRMRSTDEPAERVVFYFAFLGSMLAAIPAWLHWPVLTLTSLAWLFLLGLLATFAQLLLTSAYGYAPAGQLGTFTFSSVIFATLAGWLLWDETVTVIGFIGMGIILAAGLLVMWGQTRPLTLQAVNA